VATFGHIAAGLAVARAGTSGPSRLAVFAIVIAAVLPDVDLLLDVNHRGPTHSLGFATFVGIAAYALMRARAEPAAITIGVLCGLATVTHIVLDLLTAPSPVAVFWPLTSREFVLAEPLLPATPTDEALLTRRGLALVAGELAWSIGILLAAELARRRAPRADQA
jgi:inner membrane protein